MFDLREDRESRARLFEQVHEAHKALAPRWPVLLDALDGEGGFVGGGYLWKFPRELDSEWANRKAQARYHNYVDTIVGNYTRKLFSGISRQTENEQLEAWWQDVDGAGTPLSVLLEHQLARAMAVGHVGLLMDRTREAPAGPSRADERSRIYLTPYLPGAIRDWRLHRDASVKAVKLFEAVPQDDLLAEPLDDDERHRVLLWDEDEWVRVPKGDGVIERANHGLGLVPLVILRPLAHTRWPLVGRSLFGDGSLLKALYNRQSEEDDVLRNQAFSVFVVSADKDADVEKVRKELGTEIGTTRALFVAGGSGDYKTPDMGVPEQIRGNQQHLIREIYRLAHVSYDQDSRESESAEAKRADNEELSGILRGIAGELMRVEMAIARLWCAWSAATPEQAAQMFEAANVQVRYPDEFFEDLPLDDLELDVESLKLEAGPTFDRQVKKDAVRRLKPHLDQATLDKIDAEIESGEGTRQPGALDPQALRDGASARLSALVAQVDDGGEAAA